MDLFAVRFLALDRVPKLLPIEFVETEEAQDIILTKTIKSVEGSYPLPKNQVRNLLEAIVRTCESYKITVNEEVYEQLIGSDRVEESDSSFGSFRIGNVDVIFKVHGDPFALVQDGSTGFMTWEAGKCLSWYLCRVHDVNQKRILEIGCGTGITGITTLKLTQIKEYIFTDYHESTLANARLNWQLNCSGETDSGSAKFVVLDMHDPNTQHVETDIIVASDVLYDRDLAVALVRTLENPACRFSEAIIISTIRTQETYEFFLDTLRNSKSLKYEQVARGSYSEWIRKSDKSEWQNFLNSSTLLFDPVVELVRIFKM
jgi:hypothetical protein